MVRIVSDSFLEANFYSSAEYAGADFVSGICFTCGAAVTAVLFVGVSYFDDIFYGKEQNNAGNHDGTIRIPCKQNILKRIVQLALLSTTMTLGGLAGIRFGMGIFHAGMAYSIDKILENKLPVSVYI
jgi:hypothetical protein